MAKKKGLGRGLGALMPEKPIEPPRSVEIELLYANPEQPRKIFQEKQLQELADSIVEHGIVQPLLVRQDGDRYMIIAGERRWRAAQIAGLKSLPIHIFKGDKRAIVEVSLVENIQREDLSPLEIARTLKDLMEQFNLTQEEVGKKVGWSRSAISNKMRLLNLPEEIRKKLEEQELSEGHARALLAVEEEGIMLSIAEECLLKKWSVRELEQRIGELQSPDKPHRKIGHTPDWGRSLTTSYGISFKTTGRGKKMKLSIAGLDKEQITRIGELLEKEGQSLFPRK